MICKKMYHIDKDITTVTSGLILHGVNCQGVMGSGVAKQLRAKYPDIYISYSEHIAFHSHRAYNLLGTTDICQVSPLLTIANMFTQLYYGRDSRQYVSYEALDACLFYIQQWTIPTTEIYVPYLVGAGLGGGDESIILDIFAKNLRDRNVTFCHFGDK